MSSQRRLAVRGSIVICILGTLVLAASKLSGGPDFDLKFSRELGTTVTPGQVDAVWNDLSAWPRWFHSLGSARALNGSLGTLAKGQELALEIDPKKGERKRFTLHAKVLEYVPEKKLVLRVTYDSKHRITELFDRLDWSLELNPGPGQLNLVGEAHAHTSHWRSRFFGRLADRILMNQVFYPDLFKLAKLNEPVDDSLPPVD
jgi:hypothetical protein